MRPAVVALTAILLSGCASVGDGPSAASISVPTSFAYAPSIGSRDAIDNLLPNNDPAFRQLVTAIDTDAPDLQVALARVDAARAALRGAGAARSPYVGVDAQASRSRSSENAITNLPSGFVIDPTNSIASTGINASWDLDLFGRLRASQRAASLRVDAADADARAVRLALISDIARAVIDYRAAQSKLRILDKDVEDAAGLVNLTSSRIRAGVAPGLDLVRAQSLEAAARSQRGPADAERAIALGRLVTLTARDGAFISAAFAVPANNDLASIPAVGLPSSLLRQRPDIVAAEFRLNAANADIAAAAAARFPVISINGALGLAALALGDLLSVDSLTASLGGSIAAPLLDFGRVEAQIDSRQADAKEAFALYRRAVFSGMGEAETALGGLQANLDRLAEIDRQIIIDQDKVRLSTARYRMGLTDFLGVIEDQRQLNASRQTLIEATANARRSQIQIFRAFGG